MPSARERITAMKQKAGCPHPRLASVAMAVAALGLALGASTVAANDVPPASATLLIGAAGVDMFNLSGWYHATQQNDVAAVRELVPEAAIYLEMPHSAGSLYFACGQSAYDTASFPRTSDIQFYTTAHKAYDDGTDGVSLFNFVYFRDHGTAKCTVINELPFHVLDQITDRAWPAT